MSSTGPQVEVTLYSVFASKKKGTDVEDKQGSQASITPGNFQVSAKLDEESRKDSLLTLSFVISLNDSRGLVTYEFRGSCSIVGTSTEFSMMMEADRSRVPRILDTIYQRLYPVMFLMAGVTVAPYPQSTTLASDMISSQPLPTPTTASTAQPQSKEVAEPAPKIETSEQVATPPTARARSTASKTQSAKSDEGMQELVETISAKVNQNQKVKESLEKDSESELSATTTSKKTQPGAGKGKVAVT